MIVTSCGDSGDVLVLLAVLKNIKQGSPHTLLIEEKSPRTASGKSRESAERLQAFVHDLVVSQPYMKECRMMGLGDFPDWRSGGFRDAGFHEKAPTLMEAHLWYYNHCFKTSVKVDRGESWLTVDPSPELSGMVVINRTSRYQNKHFQWKMIVEHYAGRIVFLGLPHEHKEFCEQFGYVSYRETKTLLEMARLIAGSALFIGNQSCANAVAEGLKHPSIQETSLMLPDCVYRRVNGQFVADGKCSLPDVSGSGELEVPSVTFKPNYRTQTVNQPRSGWSFRGLSGPTFRVLKKTVMAELKLTEQEAHEGILDELFSREPEYFGPNHEEMDLLMVKAAIAGSNDWRMAAQARSAGF